MTALGTHWAGARPVPHLVDTLRRRRVNMGLSQVQLGKIAGVNNSTIAHMERGEETPRAQNLVFIAQALGLEVTALPIDPHERAAMFAEWLQARGWRVEAPPAAEDARAAGGIPGRREKPRQGASTGRETAHGDRGGT